MQKKKAPFIKENQQNVLNCVDFNYKVFTNTILHNITGFSNIVVNAAAIQQHLDETPDLFNWVAVVRRFPTPLCFLKYRHSIANNLKK